MRPTNTAESFIRCAVSCESSGSPGYGKIGAGGEGLASSPGIGPRDPDIPGSGPAQPEGAASPETGTGQGFLLKIGNIWGHVLILVSMMRVFGKCQSLTSE